MDADSILYTKINPRIYMGSPLLATCFQTLSNDILCGIVLTLREIRILMDDEGRYRVFSSAALVQKSRSVALVALLPRLGDIAYC